MEATGTTPDAQRPITTTSAVQTLNLPSTSRLGQTMRIMVDGTDPIAWAYGNSTGLTMDNGVPMVGNSVEVFGLPAEVTQLSVIGKTGGSVVRVVLGEGV